MTKTGAKVRQFTARLLLVILALAIIAGAGLYWFAYRTYSPSAQRTRYKIEETSAGATQYLHEETARWSAGLADLKNRLTEITEQSTAAEATSEGLKGQIEDFKGRLAQYEQDFGPAYREKLSAWRQKAEEALSAVKDESSEARHRVGIILRDIQQASESEKAPPPAASLPQDGQWPKAVYEQTPPPPPPAPPNAR